MGWTHTWEELESTVDGRCIVYVVKEVEVPEGYTAVVSAEQYSATVTNTHEVQETSTPKEVQETSTPQKHTKWKGVVTGDSTMLGIYAVLLIAAGVGLAVIVYKKRKQK